MKEVPHSSEEIPTAESPADTEKFAEIQRLTETEGWTFSGHEFQADQTQKISLKKDGFPDKVFRVTKPYPVIFDASGKPVKTK